MTNPRTRKDQRNEVIIARRIAGDSVAQLAKRFAISRARIYEIVTSPDRKVITKLRRSNLHPVATSGTNAPDIDVWVKRQAPLQQRRNGKSKAQRGGS